MRITDRVFGGTARQNGGRSRYSARFGPARREQVTITLRCVCDTDRGQLIQNARRIGHIGHRVSMQLGQAAVG